MCLQFVFFSICFWCACVCVCVRFTHFKFPVSPPAAEASTAHRCNASPVVGMACWVVVYVCVLGCSPARGERLYAPRFVSLCLACAFETLHVLLFVDSPPAKSIFTQDVLTEDRLNEIAVSKLIESDARCSAKCSFSLSKFVVWHEACGGC